MVASKFKLNDRVILPPILGATEGIVAWAYSDRPVVATNTSHGVANIQLPQADLILIPRLPKEPALGTIIGSKDWRFVHVEPGRDATKPPEYRWFRVTAPGWKTDAAGRRSSERKPRWFTWAEVVEKTGYTA